MTVAREGDAWVLEVRDDGHGRLGPVGNGLTGVRERVEALGGSVDVQGGAGVRLTVTLPAGGERVIRLVLAEDQAMVRGALAALLSLEPDLEVVGEAGDGDEAEVAGARAAPRRAGDRHRDAGSHRPRGGGRAARRARLRRASSS